MEFLLFCREFGNVVNRAFLVLIYWVKKLVGANLTRFGNHATLQTETLPHIHLIRNSIFQALFGEREK